MTVLNDEHSQQQDGTQKAGTVMTTAAEDHPDPTTTTAASTTASQPTSTTTSPTQRQSEGTSIFRTRENNCGGSNDNDGGGSGGGVYYNADHFSSAKSPLPSPPTSAATTKAAGKQQQQQEHLEIPNYGLYLNGSNLSNSSSSLGGNHSRQLYLGFCCDMRLAVITLNSITILIAFIGWGLLLFEEQYYDLEEHEVKFFEVTAFTFFLITVVFGSIGIFGALQYHKGMIITASIFYCIHAFIAIVAGDVLLILLAVAFIYPHFVLVQEISIGLVTETNYDDDIRHCCCCCPTATTSTTATSSAATSCV